MAFNNSTAHLVMPDVLSAIIQDYARPLFCPTKEHRALMRKLVNEFGRLQIQTCLSLKYMLQDDFEEAFGGDTYSYNWGFITHNFYIALENGVSPYYRGKRSLREDKQFRQMERLWKTIYDEGGRVLDNNISRRGGVLNQSAISQLRFQTLRVAHRALEAF